MSSSSSSPQKHHQQQQHVEDYDPDQNIDQQYIQSYGEDFSVHKLMLADEPRMNFYSKAIIQNCSSSKEADADNNFVIDCGAGSGVLSMIALRCGVKKVYSIEASDRVAQTILPNIKRNFNKLFSLSSASSFSSLSTKQQSEKAMEKEISKRWQLHHGMAETFPAEEVIEEIVTMMMMKAHGTNNNTNNKDSPVREDDDNNSGDQTNSDNNNATNQHQQTATIYLVSEWMGFYLLHEAMLNSVVHLRDRLLQQISKKMKNSKMNSFFNIELKMIPDVAEIYTAPFDLHKHFESGVKPQWNFLDLDFSFLGEVDAADLFSTERNPVIQVVHGNSLLLPGKRLISLDLMKVSVEELETLEVSASFEFPENFAKSGHGKGAALNGFAMWFSCFFAGSEEKRRQQQQQQVMTMMERGNGNSEDNSNASTPATSLLELDTSPKATPTHWKQTVVMLSDEGVSAEDIAGDTMTAKFTLQRDQRSYEIGLELE